MNTNRWTAAALGCALIALLAACGDDVPSDKLASETVRKYAEKNRTDGLVIADFVRENGWVDTSSPNRYTVRYNYQLRLEKPYGEVVLGNARKLHDESTQLRKNSGGGLFDMNSLQSAAESLGQSMAVGQWVGNQGDGFKTRYEKMSAACAPCVAWLRDPSVDDGERGRRFSAFASSWAYYEELGYKDDATAGTGVARQAWAAFMKTEKGWMPVGD